MKACIRHRSVGTGRGNAGIAHFQNPGAPCRARLTACCEAVHAAVVAAPCPCHDRYGAGAAMFGNDAVRGGGPWGAGTLAGPDGSRQPSEVELEQAVFQVGDQAQQEQVRTPLEMQGQGRQNQVFTV